VLDLKFFSVISELGDRSLLISRNVETLEAYFIVEASLEIRLHLCKWDMIMRSLRSRQAGLD
jgi:hypothetical protein